jgi:hypothetical protein
MDHIRSGFVSRRNRRSTSGMGFAVSRVMDVLDVEELTLTTPLHFSLA